MVRLRIRTVGRSMVLSPNSGGKVKVVPVLNFGNRLACLVSHTRDRLSVRKTRPVHLSDGRVGGPA
jgi:hypothetical protein